MLRAITSSVLAFGLFSLPALAQNTQDDGIFIEVSPNLPAKGTLQLSILNTKSFGYACDLVLRAEIAIPTDLGAKVTKVFSKSLVVPPSSIESEEPEFGRDILSSVGLPSARFQAATVLKQECFPLLVDIGKKVAYPADIKDSLSRLNSFQIFERPKAVFVAYDKLFLGTDNGFDQASDLDFRRYSLDEDIPATFYDALDFNLRVKMGYSAETQKLIDSLKSRNYRIIPLGFHAFDPAPLVTVNMGPTSVKAETTSSKDPSRLTAQVRIPGQNTSFAMAFLLGTGINVQYSIPIASFDSNTGDYVFTTAAAMIGRRVELCDEKQTAITLKSNLAESYCPSSNSTDPVPLPIFGDKF